MKFISLCILPLIIFLVILYGFKKKVDLYDSFIKGAYDGLKMTFNIAPHIIAMVFAINLLIKSNIIFYLLKVLTPLIGFLKIPPEIFPMAIMRPISGSASMVIMNDIFISHGPDSYLGRLASTIQGCTDTTFYVISLYFGSVGIKKIGHSLKVGLFADLIGILASFLVVYLFLC